MGFLCVLLVVKNANKYSIIILKGFQVSVFKASWACGRRENKTKQRFLAERSVSPRPAELKRKHPSPHRGRRALHKRSLRGRRGSGKKKSNDCLTSVFNRISVFLLTVLWKRDFAERNWPWQENRRGRNVVPAFQRVGRSTLILSSPAGQSNAKTEVSGGNADKAT